MSYLRFWDHPHQNFEYSIAEDQKYRRPLESEQFLDHPTLAGIGKFSRPPTFKILRG